MGGTLQRPFRGDERPGLPAAPARPVGKLREYAGRLTLILTLMHHAADPTADPLMRAESRPPSASMMPGD